LIEHPVPGDFVSWTGSTGEQHAGVLVAWTQRGHKPVVRRWLKTKKKFGPPVTVGEVEYINPQLRRKTNVD